MKVRQEIMEHADPADRPALLWLFERNHRESQWRFVATCTFRRYGTLSYECHRIWQPTASGRVLYEAGREPDWSTDWPDSEGAWWLFRKDNGLNPLTLVHVVKTAKGTLQALSELEFIYRQHQTADWRFAKAKLPRLPYIEQKEPTRCTS